MPDGIQQPLELVLGRKEEEHEAAIRQTRQGLVLPVSKRKGRATSVYLFSFFLLLFFFFLSFIFLGLHLRHMEVPRLGVQSELQLPAYTTVTATPDPSCVVTYSIAHGNTGSLTH